MPNKSLHPTPKLSCPQHNNYQLFHPLNSLSWSLLLSLSTSFVFIQTIIQSFRMNRSGCHLQANNWRFTLTDKDITEVRHRG